MVPLNGLPFWPTSFEPKGLSFQVISTVGFSGYPVTWVPLKQVQKRESVTCVRIFQSKMEIQWVNWWTVRRFKSEWLQGDTSSLDTLPGPASSSTKLPMSGRPTYHASPPFSSGFATKVPGDSLAAGRAVQHGVSLANFGWFKVSPDFLVWF